MVDRDPYGVLVLRFDDALDPRRVHHAHLTLMREVQWIRGVHVVLLLAAGTLARVVSIRDKLAVRVEDRIRAQSRGEHVRLGLRNLERLAPEIQALCQEPTDRLVEGETVRRAVIVGLTRRFIGTG